MVEFVPLHCHSVFSFHAGVSTVKELVNQAKAFGMQSVALTDTDRMSGLILFYLECVQQGIKPILGVELTSPQKPDEHIVLLAKNAEGYGDICEVITRRHLDPQFSYARIFEKAWPNLFFFTSFPHLLELIAATPNRGNLYGELINNSGLTRQRSRVLEQKAGMLGVPLMVSNDSYFLHASEWDLHKTLTAIGLSSTRSRLKPEEIASEGAYFMSAGQIERSFCNHQEAVLNTKRLADQCNVMLGLNEWILPEIDVPQGFTPDTLLGKFAMEGLEQNYGGTGEYARAKQIQEMELEVISRLGYPSYFLIVKDIRDWANKTLSDVYRRPKDCSVLRGSAANSITFYNLGVSDLDPIRYDLYFQRFLNEDRASPPDADLDFGWDERDRVIDYIIDKWGEDRVAITCTTNHFRRRAAFRETAKVYGYSEEQITQIMKSQKTGNERLGDSELDRIGSIAKTLKGRPRFLGQHPGGLLITNDPIWRHVALERSGGEKDRVITQIDMHNGIDELGLIKFDVLGNGSLSVLRDALSQIKDQSLPDPNVWDLEKCYHDPLVQDIIAKGRTKGIFYIESPAQTRLNKKAQAQTFEELTITSSLVRPAGASYCSVFIDRHRKMKAGIKDWEFLHPSLEPILKETHDVCAFQEDVTKICHHIAGLSYKKSDSVRKMMNSLHEGDVPSEQWKRTAEEFIAGCMGNKGLTQAQATELWTRVSSFYGFSFCKSHSASYAQLSFKCTYLKAYYPAQFLSAVISNNHGFYTRDAYLNEARRWGVRILPIQVNESGIKYWGKFNWIRPGLMDIRSLAQKSQEAIVLEREREGPFNNLENFITRMKIDRHEVEKLILVGAFDGFGMSQPEMLYLLDGIYGKGSSCESALFSARLRDLHPGLHDYTLTEKCLNELHLLGFMLSGDILDILDLHPGSRGAIPANEAHKYVGKGVKVFGWPVTERIHVTSTGKPMQFLSVEDKTGTVDVLFWPRSYKRFGDVLAKPGPYEIWGRIIEDWGTFSLEAQSIKAAEWRPNQVDFELASNRLQGSFQNYTYEDIEPVAAA